MPNKKELEQLEDVKVSIQNQLLPSLEAKTFKSGKTGFYTQGKLVVNGERYQSQVTIVKIEKKD